MERQNEIKIDLGSLSEVEQKLIKQLFNQVVKAFTNEKPQSSFPCVGDIYYYLDTTPTEVPLIRKSIWRNDTLGNCALKFGNVFKTESEASHESNRVAHQAKWKTLAMQSREKFDGRNRYYLYYDIHHKKLDYYVSSYKIYGGAWFGDSESLLKAVKEIGENDVVRYILEVENIDKLRSK